MLFSKVFIAAAAATLAVAMPNQPTTTVTVTASPTATTISQCNTGDAQCCNSVTSASNPVASVLLGLLGVVVQGVDVLVGLTCTSILSGGTCNSSPVCCENNNFNGLIVIGCSPITL